MIAKPLLHWHARHGRHDLPWQQHRNYYRVWVSEVMLQQTQVRTVIEYYQRFVTTLPELSDLASATQDQVLALWSGLGYYSRARNLHKAAGIALDNWGELPRDAELLITLPGIGRSTANAICALCDGARLPILDGNVKRVLCRYHLIEEWPGQAATQRRLWSSAEQHLPTNKVAAYTQAIMDLGATVCVRSNPRCGQCPLEPQCQAAARGRQRFIPVKRPTEAKPQRIMTLLLAARPEDQSILLERRTEHGIWGGLWSLPEADGVIPDTVTTVGDTEHRMQHHFTHFTAQIYLQRGEVEVHAEGVKENNRYRLCRREDLASMGIPTPVRQILNNHFGDRRDE